MGSDPRPATPDQLPLPGSAEPVLTMEAWHSSAPQYTPTRRGSRYTCDLNHVHQGPNESKSSAEAPGTATKDSPPQRGY